MLARLAWLFFTMAIAGSALAADFPGVDIGNGQIKFQNGVPGNVPLAFAPSISVE
jgi:hypothetical protein